MKNKPVIPIAYPTLPPKIKYFERISKVWQSHMLSNFSVNAQEMENIIKERLGNDNVAVVSGADIGLIISLSILELPKKSEVIVPAYTFNSTPSAILWNGLIPIFADIDAETLTIDPKDVQLKITKRTKAIIAVNTFGNPCKIDELRKIVQKNGLFLIFDSASSYGSSYKRKKVGNLGDIEVFSFSGTKIVSSAEGGAIVVNLPGLLEKIKMARNYGFLRDYNTKEMGINGKISELNASLGCLTLPNIKKFVGHRNTLAKFYKTELTGVGDIEFQKIKKTNVSNYNDFVILTSRSEGLQKFLENSGVQTKKYFFPIHKTNFYKKYYKELPVTDYIYKRCLTIPMYNNLEISDQDYVIRKIREFYK